MLIEKELRWQTVEQFIECQKMVGNLFRLLVEWKGDIMGLTPHFFVKILLFEGSVKTDWSTFTGLR